MRIMQISSTNSAEALPQVLSEGILEDLKLRQSTLSFLSGQDEERTTRQKQNTSICLI